MTLYQLCSLSLNLPTSQGRGQNGNGPEFLGRQVADIYEIEVVR